MAVKCGVKVGWSEVVGVPSLRRGLCCAHRLTLSASVLFWREGRKSSHLHNGLDSPRVNLRKTRGWLTLRSAATDHEQDRWASVQFKALAPRWEVPD